MEKLSKLSKVLLFAFLLGFWPFSAGKLFSLTEAEKSYLKTELQALRQDLQTLESKRQGLTKALETSGEELQTLNQQLEESAKQIQSLQAQVSELASQLKQSQDDLTGFKAGLKGIENERDVWRIVGIGGAGVGLLAVIFGVIHH